MKTRKLHRCALLALTILTFSFSQKFDDCINNLLLEFKSEQLFVKAQKTYADKQIVSNKEISGLLKSGACNYRNMEKIEKAVVYKICSKKTSGFNLKIEQIFVSNAVVASNIYNQIINNPPDKVCVPFKNDYHYLLYKNQIMVISGSPVIQEELRNVTTFLNNCFKDKSSRD